MSHAGGGGVALQALKRFIDPVLLKNFRFPLDMFTSLHFKLRCHAFISYLITHPFFRLIHLCNKVLHKITLNSSYYSLDPMSLNNDSRKTSQDNNNNNTNCPFFFKYAFFFLDVSSIHGCS